MSCMRSSVPIIVLLLGGCQSTPYPDDWPAPAEVVNASECVDISGIYHDEGESAQSTAWDPRWAPRLSWYLFESYGDVPGTIVISQPDDVTLVAEEISDSDSAATATFSLAEEQYECADGKVWISEFDVFVPWAMASVRLGFWKGVDDSLIAEFHSSGGTWLPFPGAFPPRKTQDYIRWAAANGPPLSSPSSQSNWMTPGNLY